MFADERHAIILEDLTRHGRVNASELAERFNTTRETIRRDLSTLEEAGSLRRVHGGAVAFDLLSTLELPVNQREHRNLGPKSRIGRAARKLVTTGGTSLIIDGGTTTLQLASALIESPVGPEPLMVLTHSLTIAGRVADGAGNPRLELVGGQLRTMTLSTVGQETLRRYGEVQADIAFLGTNAVTAGFGLSTPDTEEAAVKRAVIRAAKRAVVLADGEKFQDAALNRFAHFEDIDVLITDRTPPSALRDELDRADVELIVTG